MVYKFRRSWDIRPDALNKESPYHPINIETYNNVPKELIPDTESLKDTYNRVVKYFEEEIKEKLKNKNILISAHGNSIRALCKNLFNLDNDQISNSDTLWSENYSDEINKMQNFYFSKKLNNILLLANKRISFDQNFKGDFELINNLIKKNKENNFIFIGCQILNRSLFEKNKKHKFSISEIWNDLIKSEKLNGFESFHKFYHLTNLDNDQISNLEIPTGNPLIIKMNSDLKINECEYLDKERSKSLVVF